MFWKFVDTTLDGPLTRVKICGWYSFVVSNYTIKKLIMTFKKKYLEGRGCRSWEFECGDILPCKCMMHCFQKAIDRNIAFHAGHSQCIKLEKTQVLLCLPNCTSVNPCWPERSKEYYIKGNMEFSSQLWNVAFWACYCLSTAMQIPTIFPNSLWKCFIMRSRFW